MNEQKRTVGPVTQSAGLGAAAALILAFVAKQVVGVELPGEVQAALAVLITWLGATVGGWLVRPGTGSRRA